MDTVENATTRRPRRGTNAQRRRNARLKDRLKRRGAAGWASAAESARAQKAGRRDPKIAILQLDAELERAGMAWIVR